VRLMNLKYLTSFSLFDGGPKKEKIKKRTTKNQGEMLKTECKNVELRCCG